MFVGVLESQNCDLFNIKSRVRRTKTSSPRRYFPTESLDETNHNTEGSTLKFQLDLSRSVLFTPFGPSNTVPLLLVPIKYHMCRSGPLHPLV